MIFAAALLLSQSAFAGFHDGNELKKWADAYDRIDQGYARKTDHEDLMQLYGYVAGVVDSNHKIILCIPAGVTVRQSVAIVVKYLNKNPEQWQKEARLLTLYALAPVFPCEKKE